MAIDTFLTPRECAERLHVSKASVLRWINEGSLAAARLSRRTILIKEHDLSTFVDAHRTSPVPDDDSDDDLADGSSRPIPAEAVTDEDGDDHSIGDDSE